MRFPGLQSNLRNILANEMEKVCREEAFLKDEPDRLEVALRRCKKLTGTLVTLKRWVWLVFENVILWLTSVIPPRPKVGECSGAANMRWASTHRGDSPLSIRLHSKLEQGRRRMRRLSLLTAFSPKVIEQKPKLSIIKNETKWLFTKENFKILWKPFRYHESSDSWILNPPYDLPVKTRLPNSFELWQEFDEIFSNDPLPGAVEVSLPDFFRFLAFFLVF